MVIATMVQLVQEEVSVTVQMIGKGVPIVLFQPLKTSIPQVTMELRCTHIQKHCFTRRVFTCYLEQLWLGFFGLASGQGAWSNVPKMWLQHHILLLPTWMNFWAGGNWQLLLPPAMNTGLRLAISFCNDLCSTIWHSCVSSGGVLFFLQVPLLLDSLYWL